MKFDNDEKKVQLSYLNKRMLGYSALAGVMLGGAHTADAVVHKTVVNATNLTTYSFDPDGDTVTDFRLSVNSSMSGGYYLFHWRGRGVKAATAGYSAVMNYGDTIGPSRSFTNGHLVRDGVGPWGGVSDKYLGLYFNSTLDASVHYAWVKLSVNAVNYHFDVLEWAWEDVADQAILAGSDVSLPVELTSFDAVTKNGTVTISWTTQSEQDNLGFILERQQAGEESWQPIASYLNEAALTGHGTVSTKNEYTWQDNSVMPGKTYSYRLSDVDVNGATKAHGTVQVTVSETTVPNTTELTNAYPNPFNPSTKFAYRLAKDTHVTLTVMDITGRTVKTLVNEANYPAGEYELTWDGTDHNNITLPSGVYLLVFKADNQIQTQKVTLLH